MRSTVTTNLALRASGGSAQTAPSSKSVILLRIYNAFINSLTLWFYFGFYFILISSGVSEKAGT